MGVGKIWEDLGKRKEYNQNILYEILKRKREGRRKKRGREEGGKKRERKGGREERKNGQHAQERREPTIRFFVNLTRK